MEAEVVWVYNQYSSLADSMEEYYTPLLVTENYEGDETIVHILDELLKLWLKCWERLEGVCEQ